MNNIHRTRNGHVDNGTPITNVTKCPNCGSADYKETVSLEICGGCGLRNDYWGKTTNNVSRAHQERSDEKRDLAADKDEATYLRDNGFSEEEVQSQMDQRKSERNFWKKQAKKRK
jgi:hypothetical protein